MANIILKDKNGVNKVYTGVEKIVVPTSDGGTAEFTQGGGGSSGSDSELFEALIAKELEGSHTLSVSNLGPYTFYGCGSLEEINAPNCTDIGSECFADCYSLINVNAPLTTSIGVYVFNNCESLTELYFPEVNYIDSDAFVNCYGLTIVTLGKVYNLPPVFPFCYFLTDIYLGYEGLVTLESDLGYQCSAGSGSCRVHVRSEYASQYTDATNWSDLIDSGLVEIIGDYEE